MPPRRIAAVVLPRLLCEIAAREHAGSRRPIAVVRLASARSGDTLSEQHKLDAVDERARRAGLRPGLTIAEARAYVAALEVRVVTDEQVQLSLAAVAEVAMAFGPTVSVSAPDAVFLDLTGAAHLAGGEESLAAELRTRTAALDHVARVAVADGPRIAACVAREASSPVVVVPPGQGHKALAALPITALPLPQETLGWLVRVGVMSVGDLARLPRDQVASRLADRAADVLTLLSGCDPEPLVAYEPPRVVSEQARWEEGVEQQSALVFVLNRLASRIAARLEGRAEAARVLVVQLECDSAIARLRGVAPTCTLRVELPAPLSHADELLRAMRPRLEQLQLGAPALSMSLEAALITRAPRVQLDLSRDVNASPDTLPVLLAELSAELGPGRVGTLRLQSSYRPESRSMLQPVGPAAHLRPSAPNPSPQGAGLQITRLLPEPRPLGSGPICAGDLVLCMPASLEIKQLHFDVRLQGVDWWTHSPISRDYARAWLTSSAAAKTGASGAYGWLYIDRSTGESWLHGWLE